ncbi:uncharacterized protein LACBIDRAFT_308630 [Laccaria bicolor S238N-H82]|uniref:Predicted protein n=1 Tax=Laccaria bicolor (strain S238N-H82 / ATCC MYA-4686) TaxID=486041 RepID=B0CWU1_LACBS|nr:uncharacterized protein LACBIDRAFT_308630 [Laccaria bicolor S238N-H82]EDR13565.1 predicted protein [Laccaria bicolor S238N-H82]|eukprot:XP_001876063.1 predicted protein [Laccaria bicolor S238N-H82]
MITSSPWNLPESSQVWIHLNPFSNDVLALPQCARTGMGACGWPTLWGLGLLAGTHSATCGAKFWTYDHANPTIPGIQVEAYTMTRQRKRQHKSMDAPPSPTRHRYTNSDIQYIFRRDPAFSG